MRISLFPLFLRCAVSRLHLINARRTEQIAMLVALRNRIVYWRVRVNCPRYLMRANLVRNFNHDFISLYLSRFVRITAEEFNNYFIRLSNG